MRYLYHLSLFYLALALCRGVLTSEEMKLNRLIFCKRQRTIKGPSGSHGHDECCLRFALCCGFPVIIQGLTEEAESLSPPYHVAGTEG